MVRGLAEEAGRRIAIAHRLRPFTDVNDMATRAQLDRGDLNALARADALVSLAGHRRNAYWHTVGVELPSDIGTEAPLESMLPDLPAPTEGENIVEDYRNLSLTLCRHPLSLLRATLRKRRILETVQINAARHGQLVRVSGLVTCRQRPRHVERQGEVVHVIAGRLQDDTALLGKLEVTSRDFH